MYVPYSQILKQLEINSYSVQYIYMIIGSNVVADRMFGVIQLIFTVKMLKASNSEQ